MKKHILFRMVCISIVSFLTIFKASAQEFSTKYGKITQDELSMTVCDFDTAAVAVVLYKIGDTQYEYINNDFRVEYTVEAKIKILKQEGTKYADIAIPYYYNDKIILRKKE